MSFPVNTQQPVTGKAVAKGGGKTPLAYGPLFPTSIFQWLPYLASVPSEWGRITWPGQLQLVGLVSVVLVIVAALSAMLWGIDTVLRLLIGLITPKA
jgi:preprotein translocase SecE subunit